MQALVGRLLPVIQTEVGHALLRAARIAGRDPRHEVCDFVQEVFLQLLSSDHRTLRAWDPERGPSLDSDVQLAARRQVAAMLRSGRNRAWAEQPVDDTIQELDELANAIGRRAEQREYDQRAPEWAAVVRGELTVEAAVERRRSLGDDQDFDRATECFTPFDPDETGILVDSLLARSEAESTAFEQQAQADVLPLQPAAQAPGSEATHAPSPSGVWWVPAGLLLATAAAIALWMVLPPNDDVRDLTRESAEPIAKIEPLPNYLLETDGGLARLRGRPQLGVARADEPASGRHQYRRDTAFEWILRPATTNTEPVGVRGFVFVHGGSAGLPLKLDELAQVSDSGTIEIAGTIAQLGLEPGRYTIALAVGRPAGLPEQAIELSELNAAVAADGSWHVRRIAIEIDG